VIRNLYFPVILLMLAGWLMSDARASDQAGGSDRGRADLNTIVQHMEEAARQQRENIRPYVVTREYQMFGKDDPTPRSEVTAEVSFVPPSSREFRITESKGSERGESIIRHILEGEKKTAEEGTRNTAITHDNYDFALVGEQSLDGHRCYLLGLTPKRREKSLVRGQAWVDAETYLIRKIDGEMAKLPSWWLKDISLSLTFGEVGGMWMQTATRAVAELRLFGEHTLVSRVVSFQPNITVASDHSGPVAPAGRNTRFGRGDTSLGSGIMPRR